MSFSLFRRHSRSTRCTACRLPCRAFRTNIEFLWKGAAALLHRQTPLVTVAESTIRDAGVGVFAMEDTIPAGTVVCLYPGEWTPPLPHSIVRTVSDRMLNPEDYYLADDTTDGASSSSLEHNPYLLNLQQVGGHIDASAAAVDGRNSSAVGHKINHPSVNQTPNVNVISFVWKDVVSSTDRIPNTTRSDESPWFLHPETGEIVAFSRDTVPPPAGAAFTTIRKVRDGEELFFDYSLRGPPFPPWARDWYTPTST